MPPRCIWQGRYQWGTSTFPSLFDAVKTGFAEAAALRSTHLRCRTCMRLAFCEPRITTCSGACGHAFRYQRCSASRLSTEPHGISLKRTDAHVKVFKHARHVDEALSLLSNDKRPDQSNRAPRQGPKMKAMRIVNRHLG